MCKITVDQLDKIKLKNDRLVQSSFVLVGPHRAVVLVGGL